MLRFRALRILPFALLVSSTACLRAQLPTDGEVWKERCNLLSSTLTKAGTNGAVPPALVAATRGVPGIQFYTLAVDRAANREHFVACTLYILGAIADRAGNGGKPDPKTAVDYTILAGAELKLATHQKLRLADRLKRDEMKFAGVGHPLTLSANETAAVLAASTTTPVTLGK